MEKAGIVPASLRFSIYRAEEGFGFSKSIEPSGYLAKSCVRVVCGTFLPELGLQIAHLSQGDSHPGERVLFSSAKRSSRLKPDYCAVCDLALIQNWHTLVRVGASVYPLSQGNSTRERVLFSSTRQTSLLKTDYYVLW
jgi:hypothetical protein